MILQLLGCCSLDPTIQEKNFQHVYVCVCVCVCMCVGLGGWVGVGAYIGVHVYLGLPPNGDYSGTPHKGHP